MQTTAQPVQTGYRSCLMSGCRGSTYGGRREPMTPSHFSADATRVDPLHLW